jgi:hypothetical protein
VPGSTVVKAFSTVPAPTLLAAEIDGAPLDTFVASDDDAAKNTAIDALQGRARAALQARLRLRVQIPPGPRHHAVILSPASDMIKHTLELPATRRVVVVGGGFGGFFATRELCRLKPGEAVVTLVSDTDAMLYQPLLPDVAVGALDPAPRGHSAAHHTAPGPDRARPGIVGRHRPAQRRGLALQTRTVDVPYDLLLLAPGAVTRTRDIPGLAEHAVGSRRQPKRSTSATPSCPSWRSPTPNPIRRDGERG